MGNIAVDKNQTFQSETSVPTNQD